MLLREENFFQKRWESSGNIGKRPSSVSQGSPVVSGSDEFPKRGYSISNQRWSTYLRTFLTLLTYLLSRDVDLGDFVKNWAKCRTEIFRFWTSFLSRDQVKEIENLKVRARRIYLNAPTKSTPTRPPNKGSDLYGQFFEPPNIQNTTHQMDKAHKVEEAQKNHTAQKPALNWYFGRKYERSPETTSWYKNDKDESTSRTKHTIK